MEHDLAATTPLAALRSLGSVIMLNDVARPPHAHGDSAGLALTASICWQGISAVDWRAWRSGAVLLLWTHAVAVAIAIMRTRVDLRSPLSTFAPL